MRMQFSLTGSTSLTDLNGQPSGVDGIPRIRGVGRMVSYLFPPPLYRYRAAGPLCGDKREGDTPLTPDISLIYPDISINEKYLS